MSFFYSKFALNNLVKNKRFIIPYVLSTIFTIMSFYILSSLAFGDNLNKLPNGIEATKQVLSLGIIVIAIFSTIFLFYTYSFLVKRRVREFGLYAVLGMTKKTNSENFSARNDFYRYNYHSSRYWIRYFIR